MATNDPFHSSNSFFKRKRSSSSSSNEPKQDKKSYPVASSVDPSHPPMQKSPAPSSPTDQFIIRTTSTSPIREAELEIESGSGAELVPPVSTLLRSIKVEGEKKYGTPRTRNFSSTFSGAIPSPAHTTRSAGVSPIKKDQTAPPPTFHK